MEAYDLMHKPLNQWCLQMYVEDLRMCLAAEYAAA